MLCLTSTWNGYVVSTCNNTNNTKTSKFLDKETELLFNPFLANILLKYIFSGNIEKRYFLMLSGGHRTSIVSCKWELKLEFQL